MNKNILVATNLNVWSIAKGVGAPSFYKTIELYNDNGYNVFLYTSEKNLDLHELANVTIIQLPKLSAVRSKYIYPFHRIFNYILYQFIFLTIFIMKQKQPIDIYYGYEIEFIPVLKFLSKIKNKVFISRFQGTILAPLMSKFLWKLKYFPHYLSIKLKSTLTIMTNDGTRGDKVTEVIRKSNDRFLFIKNGVDMIETKDSLASDYIQTLIDGNNEYDYNFISVSRLQSWKRLDRSIQVFEEFLKTTPNCRYIIVGDGEKKLMLEEYVRSNSLADKIIFTGGIAKPDINQLMKNSDIFLSHYELSNVGNPLWEALSNECLVVTISNGDTGLIIKDGLSGVISSEAHYMDNVKKLNELLVNSSKVDELITNGTAVLQSSVTSWDDRMMVELSKVETLLP